MEDLKQTKILMIEDEAMHRHMYGLQFKQNGYENFSSAESGEKGLKAMKENKPDLLLLDIGLEDMDGIEVLKRMKADENLKNISVIVLSNMREKDKGAEARELGADLYLLKADYLPQEVLAKVERFFKNKKSQ